MSQKFVLQVSQSARLPLRTFSGREPKTSRRRWKQNMRKSKEIQTHNSWFWFFKIKIKSGEDLISSQTTRAFFQMQMFESEPSIEQCISKFRKQKKKLRNRNQMMKVQILQMEREPKNHKSCFWYLENKITRGKVKIRWMLLIFKSKSWGVSSY